MTNSSYDHDRSERCSDVDDTHTTRSLGMFLDPCTAAWGTSLHSVNFRSPPLYCASKLLAPNCIFRLLFHTKFAETTEMEQLRAVNALEPFVLLSKSATAPRGAADLISQATSSPNTYVFAELLQTPNIQALRNSKEYSSHLTLLEIFAWGSYADYQGLTYPAPSLLRG